MRPVARWFVLAGLALFAVSAPGEAQGAGERVRGAGRALARAAEIRQTQRATERFDPIFKKYTKRYFGVGTDWRWFKAQGMAESDLTPTARSRVGARGQRRAHARRRPAPRSLS